jgi:1,4-alpha-glucan branching enzyme
MQMLGHSGVWELFIPNLSEGSLYKFEIRAPKAPPFFKADPYAQFAEVPPNTSSIVYSSRYKFRDAKWMKNRAGREHFRQPLSIYEVHFGSWRRKMEDENRPFTYREMAEPLADYVGNGFHSRRVSAAQGTSVWTIVGLSGQLLLRAFGALRDARTIFAT